MGNLIGHPDRFQPDPGPLVPGEDDRNPYHNLFFVDCESRGPCPALGICTEFAAASWEGETFHGVLATPDSVPFTTMVPTDREMEVFEAFYEWLLQIAPLDPGPGPIFVSDNPAFDWQWINDGFWRTLGTNPFGHSARRISDFYAGLCGDWRKTQPWKRFRNPKHDHNPVNDALGNLAAFKRVLAGER